MTRAYRPPFAYYGGKTTLADRVVDLLPPQLHYVEPFAGGLSVLLAKPRVAFETVNDLDRDLMTFWRVLRDHPAELARVCALTPHSRAEHADAYTLTGRPPGTEPGEIGRAAARTTAEVSDVERARRVWVRLSQGRAGTLRRTGWRFYRGTHRRSGAMPATLNAYVDRMHDVAERLAGVSLECRPALEVIADYGQHPDVLLYVDPPYLGTTRSHGHHYRHEMRRTDQHEELLETLRSCRSDVVLSGYRSDLYDQTLAGWVRVDLPAFTGQGGHLERAAGLRTECLWLSRTPEDLFTVGAS